MTRAHAFNAQEVLLAGLLAGAIEMGLFLLLVVAGENALKVKAAKEPEPPLMPIKVMPVLDDTPLLKLGGKKVKAKLPEMWRKNPPVQRFQEASAPSPQAKKTPDAIPTSALAKPDAEAPPPDAEVAKEVDQTLLDAGPDAESKAEGEGAADGVGDFGEVEAFLAVGAEDLDLGDGEVLVAEDVTPVVVGLLVLGGDGQFLEGEVLGDGRSAHGS